jgi:hypothetical protein
MDERDRPVGWLLGAAGAVALITLGVVLRFGIASPPELAALDGATRPEQALAILAYSDSARGQCLHVVGPDALIREVRCSLDGVGPLLGWDERGIVVLRYASVGERLEVIDPVDGTVVASEAFDTRELGFDAWRSQVDVERSGRTLTVRDSDRRIIWQVEAPDNYWINASARHPVTGAVAMIDTAGRLLVLADGAAAPGVWVESLDQRYGEIVWQGTPVRGD